MGGRPTEAASTNLGRLVLGFDGILPDDLDGFVAQRIEILEGLRIAVCNRLVKAIELSDAHMLTWEDRLRMQLPFRRRYANCDRWPAVAMP
jgi:hypothetical protein